ncbi:hypothetical protein FCULG_00000913 [Fusarium culmorum]|uniref:Uncharacterized protein n=1 Tax=Fusarium culmorum TaxID=5516 RepID=A0A2T4GLC8_FUSCU|nr:hypothetical protein FCULG_00000913 [Fusarium culmorum]
MTSDGVIWILSRPSRRDLITQSPHNNVEQQSGQVSVLSCQARSRSGLSKAHAPPRIINRLSSKQTYHSIVIHALGTQSKHRLQKDKHSRILRPIEHLQSGSNRTREEGLENVTGYLPTPKNRRAPERDSRGPSAQTHQP